MIKNKLKAPEGREKERYLQLFIVAFLGMAVCFIPSLIQNKGIFMYYGDFNSQQIMFYKHAHQMVRSGNMGWDWGTDLGSGFVSTYSFYLLGSPFFWLTTLFPEGSTMYLMPWLLCLKTATAAVCAYAYLRRFVNDKNCAVIGSLLYAFSGFQTYNVFFNHFHDATAFFPLLLLAFELTVQENKKGPFALAVALTAVINYYFFVAAVVFTLIYFFLRATDKKFDINMKKFITLAIESVMGLAMSCLILLPSVLMVMKNYRVNERFVGLDYILYNDKARVARIFQAFFTLSDMPARVNIFDVDSARWASLAGYLPLFSMCGVIAYMRTREKRDWLCKSVIVFVIMACVPFLNSAFMLFNSAYYARWFYMPILLFAMMTSKVIEEDHTLLKKGYIPTALAGVGFLMVGLLPKYEGQDLVWGKLAQYRPLYIIQVSVTLLMIVSLGILIYVIAKRKVSFTKVAVFMTAVACVICNTSEVLYGVTQGSENPDYIERAIFGGKDVHPEILDAEFSYGGEDSDFYRIDTSEDVDNWCMFWDLSSMRCFHSCVDPSIMDFYSEMGQTRDVASRMEKNVYPFRALLSVRYYFDEMTEAQINGDEENPMYDTIEDLEGFTYIDTMNGFNIYENHNYIPMGFAYDMFTYDSSIKDAGEVEKTVILSKALVLDDSQAAQYSDYIDYYDPDEDYLNYEEFEQNCADRKAQSCYYFRHDTHGFTGKINLDSPKLVFFSVPYESGWSAKVNGVDTKVEKVDYGLMAVLVPEGDSEIVFTYHAEGQKTGIILTCAGFAAFAVYMLYWNYFTKNGKKKKDAPAKKERTDNGAEV